MGQQEALHYYVMMRSLTMYNHKVSKYRRCKSQTVLENVLELRIFKIIIAVALAVKLVSFQCVSVCRLALHHLNWPCVCVQACFAWFKLIVWVCVQAAGGTQGPAGGFGCSNQGKRKVSGTAAGCQVKGQLRWPLPPSDQRGQYWLSTFQVKSDLPCFSPIFYLALPLSPSQILFRLKMENVFQ